MNKRGFTMAIDFNNELCKVGKAKLQTLKYKDFIKMALPYFKIENTEKVLEKFKALLSQDEWYCLCFRYRDVPEFLSSSIIGFEYGIEFLRAEAGKHIQEVKKLTKELTAASSIKEGKNDHIYRELYEESCQKNKKINLRKKYDSLKKAGKITMSYNAFRQGYARWIQKNPDPSLRKKNWPTKEFLSFFAFVSVHYAQNTESGSAKKILLINDSSAWELRQIWKTAIGLRCAPCRETDEVRFKKINNLSNVNFEDKQKKLKDLATRNNLSAIEYLMRNNNCSEELSLRAAILLPEKYGPGRGWKVKWWDMFPMEPYNHFKSLRNRNMEWQLGKNIIPAKSIVRKISFEINLNNDEWKQSKLRKYELPDTPYINPELKECSIEKPSPYDFDEIMKIGDIVNYICFEFSKGKEIRCDKKNPLSYTLTEEEKRSRAVQTLITKLKEGDSDLLPSELRSQIKSWLTEIEHFLKKPSVM